MLKNNIKVAFRSLWKNKNTSIINILGLGIAIFASILIFLYVNFEFSFDKFHSKSDRIYRIVLEDNNLGVSENEAGITFIALGPELKRRLPEVEEQVRILKSGRELLTLDGTESYYTKDLSYSTTELFNVFDFPLIQGDKENVLSRPRTAVINETWKEKLFGDQNPIGKTIKMNNEDTYEITGVMKDVPENSHLQFDVLLSMVPTEADSNFARYLETWNSIGMPTYVLLNDKSSEEKVNASLIPIMEEHVNWGTFGLKLQPLDKVHLYSSGILFDNHNVNKTDVDYLYSLIAVAIFIIIIAAFNFMNLSTARSTARAMEVGLRKVVGAKRVQMIIQFLSESVILCFTSLLIALILVEIFAPALNLPIKGSITLYFVKNINLILSLIGSVLLLGMLSGIYPALVLSGFKPIKVLRGSFKTSKSGIWLRRVLVVAQFTASIVMIIGTTIVYNQLQYIQNKNMGFKSDQVININLDNQNLQSKSETFKSELANIPGIKMVGASNSMPGSGFGRTSIEPEGYNSEETWITSILVVDDNYFNTLGMEMAEGRAFSKDYPSDQDNSIIINESAARKLGWTDNPIGKKFTVNESPISVVGVVKDFHFENMQHQIEPLVIRYNPDVSSVISLKVSPQNVASTISAVESVWKNVYPSYPFEYRFFDEAFANLFKNDRQFSNLITNFTILAILIACLGLFGLAAFTADQKTKEIGMRKILGADVRNIMFLLSKDFAVLVIIASIIASPIAYLTMNGWLEGFVYRTDMNAFVYILSAFAALLIALLTISFHTYRAANANPVKSLRSE